MTNWKVYGWRCPDCDRRGLVAKGDYSRFQPIASFQLTHRLLKGTVNAECAHCGWEK